MLRRSRRFRALCSGGLRNSGLRSRRLRNSGLRSGWRQILGKLRRGHCRCQSSMNDTISLDVSVPQSGTFRMCYSRFPLIDGAM